ncbi:hypothetical protein PSE_4621 [Pseudovibrio sp. FO-BEG1]|uniref:DUF6630 family protein n=1 Tax=Pseudovibrio sp. (strain FO-BEG1) TaxID=911045 RepID=UPI000238CA6E|nr:hypothetical protein [Pseudovibrio sp. FO-BEG1]AEV39123.1 hypothetical protein PSE_4621 [Pseudovibrio sp. FO-BEG1]
MKIIFITLLVLAIAFAAFYSIRQGMFDAERVRLVRMLTNNDTRAIQVARAIEAGVTEEKSDTIFKAAGDEFDIELDNKSVTLAWYLIEFFAYTHPEHAYFDWKDNSEDIGPEFDDMLKAHGISKRPDMDLLMQHEMEFASEHTAFPVNLAHYAPIFDKAGLALVTLDANWDSYYVFVVEKSTAYAWRNVTIEDPNKEDRLIIQIVTPPQEDLSKAQDLDEVFDLMMSSPGRIPVPYSASLPLKKILTL